MDAGLSSEIQRALQIAVGEANSPFAQGSTRKETKKRKGQDESNDVSVKKKKRKKDGVKEGELGSVAEKPKKLKRKRIEAEAPSDIAPPEASQTLLASIMAKASGSSSQSESLRTNQNTDLARALAECDSEQLASLLQSCKGPPRPSTSTSDFLRESRPKPKKIGRKLDMSQKPSTNFDASDHQTLLSHKWMTAAKLADMVREEGK